MKGGSTCDSAASPPPGDQYQWPQLCVKEHATSKQQVSKGGDTPPRQYHTETKIGTGVSLPLTPLNEMYEKEKNL